MYNKFFGFREKPFKLVPNPVYLFLSKSHEEALAYLNYAISQGDGFVEITGEVGTGKTTLCRAFLQSLDSDAEAAYIFNPKLESKQLIQAINDELGIKTHADNTKDLIDVLNAFLIRKKSEGKKVLVLIDEAQNLPQSVLEQLRLLSNLETTQDKLLQIILVGQPELADILDSHELRQLGQRITLRYHLLPLNYDETKAYIRYRLNIAAQKQAVKFDRAAFKHIYRYSKGIPRLINIVCDRALLTAYGLNQCRITGGIARASIRELTSRGVVRSHGLISRKKVLAALSLGVLCLLAVVIWQPAIRGQTGIWGVLTHFKTPKSTEPETVNGQKPKIVNKSVAALPIQDPPIIDAPAAAIPLQNPPQDPDPAVGVLESIRELNQELGARLLNLDRFSSRQAALAHAVDLWDANLETPLLPDEIGDDQDFFRLAVRPLGLLIHRLEFADLDLLASVNLPAILELYAPNRQMPVYLTLNAIDGDRIRLGGVGGNQSIEISGSELDYYWSGVAYILWKNFRAIWGTIPGQSDYDSILTLKLLLQEIGFPDLELTADYDFKSQQAVKRIQAKYNIPIDGVVGPLTKIILYRENAQFKLPRLTPQRPAQSTIKDY
ncbi:MAG: AAA family ATPase [Desulfobacterales bacterium]|nr:MAG: AAA family ATPase [Desulfobacterales bacterium]